MYIGLEMIYDDGWFAGLQEGKLQTDNPYDQKIESENWDAGWQDSKRVSR
jgi:ribosome modulation factor